MLPFATRTDMLDALKNKDVKIATVEEFLHSLQCEHGLPNVRDQLRRLWTKYVRDLYSEEDDADDGESARKNSFESTDPAANSAGWWRWRLKAMDGE